MSEQERKDMIEQLVSEGMSREEAEQKVMELQQQQEESVSEGEPTETVPESEETVDDHQAADAGSEDEPEVLEDEPAAEPAETEGEPAGEGDQDTFSRDYVTKLRREAAGYRDKAKDRDALAQRLHVALVAADGRLADPEDLPYSEEYLEDPEALADAITELISRKPGLRAQQVTGDVGQGRRGSGGKAPADLISIIKGL